MGEHVAAIMMTHPVYNYSFNHAHALFVERALISETVVANSIKSRLL